MLDIWYGSRLYRIWRTLSGYQSIWKYTICRRQVLFRLQVSFPLTKRSFISQFRSKVPDASHIHVNVFDPCDRYIDLLGMDPSSGKDGLPTQNTRDYWF